MRRSSHVRMFLVFIASEVRLGEWLANLPLTVLRGFKGIWTRYVSNEHVEQRTSYCARIFTHANYQWQ